MQGFFNQSACVSLSSLKDKMGKSFFVIVYAATTGGYCRVPNECICRSGYSGATCQTGNCFTLEIFQCESAWYVQNRWSCTSSFPDLMPCERQTPCQNGATCSNDGSGGYTCTCLPGWEGTNCGSERNECASNPCQNGATCTVSDCSQVM